jgi:hypothetical protein
MKEFNQSTNKVLVAFAKILSLSKWQDLQRTKVEGIEVEVDKVEGKWKTKDCYQYNLWIDNEALGGNEVLALPDMKTAAD